MNVSRLDAFRARHPEIHIMRTTAMDYVAWGGVLDEPGVRSADLGALVGQLEFILGDVHPETADSVLRS